MLPVCGPEAPARKRPCCRRSAKAKHDLIDGSNAVWQAHRR